MPDCFVSICIPTYNRPDFLLKLLNSIDSCHSELEIVICENDAPKRAETRKCVEEFSKSSKYTVHYFENSRNLDYDGNIHEIIKKSRGEFLIIMGDDDEFIPGQLDGFIDYIESNRDKGFIMRAYRNIYNGDIEYFKYYKENKVFKGSIESYIELSRRCSFVSGCTFKREIVNEFITEDLMGTYIIHIYLIAEITLKYESAYYAIPFVQSIKEGVDEGYVEQPIKQSIDLVNAYLQIASYMDKKYGFVSRDKYLKEMSRYSYAILAFQRLRENKSEFHVYCKELEKIGFGCTKYFYLYWLGLSVFGKKNCDALIRVIKAILGKTPRL